MSETRRSRSYPMDLTEEQRDSLVALLSLVHYDDLALTLLRKVPTALWPFDAADDARTHP